MRRDAFALAGVILLFGCGGKGVTIYAPPQLAEASIFIDGKPAGQFQKTQREYRWLGWSKMKEELRNAPRSETIAKLPPVLPGKHVLRIEKTGYEPIRTSFDYSAGRVEIEIDDAQLKPAAQSSPVTSRQP